MIDFEVTAGYTTLSTEDDCMGRRVRLEMQDVDQGAQASITLNPEQAHDLIAALRNVAQHRIPDDTEDGAADRAHDAYVDDELGVL